MVVHAFLSFDNWDIRLVNLFRGQAKNTRLDLEFADYSLKAPINSERAPYLKQQIKKRIKRCSVVLCLIGRSTHRSAWVKWELETGYELGKCLVGVRLNSDKRYVKPKPLNDHPAKVVGWTINDIMDAIEECRGDSA